MEGRAIAGSFPLRASLHFYIDPISECLHILPRVHKAEICSDLSSNNLDNGMLEFYEILKLIISLQVSMIFSSNMFEKRGMYMYLILIINFFLV